MIKTIILGLFTIALLIIIYIFGFQFFPAFFLSVKDSIKKSFSRKRGDIPIFNMYGVYIFSGRVGCGKTISMVRRAESIKRKYPRVKVLANFSCSVADGFISSWQDVVNAENIDENGVNQGVLFLFDEIHLTFDSQGWRNAPDNLLEYISLQRHLHKCIFGASQVWSRVNKIIKEQTDYIVECKSYFNARLITNNCYTNEDYQINGTMKDSGHRKRPTVYKDTFVATDKLRSLYDTDEIIKGLSLREMSPEEKSNRQLLHALRDVAKP